MGLVDAWFSAIANGAFRDAAQTAKQATAQQLAVAQLRVYQSKKKKERPVFKFKLSDPGGWTYSSLLESWQDYDFAPRKVRVELWRGKRLIETRTVRCGWWFAWRLARTKSQMIRRAVIIARARTDVLLTPGDGFKETQRPSDEQ